MQRQSGFTLIEILVVLSLVAVLMGLSVGFISRSSGGNELIMTTNAVANQLAAARAQSYGDNRAYVLIDTGLDGLTRTRSYRNRQVFAWACEDFSKASEPDYLEKVGAVEISQDMEMEGRYAKFDAGGQIHLGDPPWLDFVDGFRIECRINPAKTGVLFKKGTTIQVNLIGGDAGRMGIEARVRLQPTAGNESSGGLYEIRTGTREGETVREWGSPLIPGRWSKLVVSYNREVLTIHVDGRLRGIRSDRHGTLNLNDDPFVIGGGYAGGFDSLLISGIFEDDDDRFDVPESVVRLDEKGLEPAKGKVAIHFANRSLDPRYHQVPIDLWFRLDRGRDDKGARRVVRVALSGENFVKRPGEQ